VTTASNTVGPGSLQLQLSGSARREIDLHAIRLAAERSPTLAYNGGDMSPGMTFSVGDLAGEGRIAGGPVGCLSVEMQFRGHTGYELPGRQIPDLELLRERFGVEPTR
jgi:hypothetical protein